VPYLTVEGDRKIRFEHYRGSGRAVVLVHGWGMGARCWDTTLGTLVQHGHEVVAFDQRCCAGSDKDFVDVSVGANGSDVVALVEACGLVRPVLNGWSFGGAVAVDAAAKLGDNLGGLVLTGGATPRYTAAPDWPHGGTPEDIAGTLAALSTARVETFAAVAQATCAVDVGEPTRRWMLDLFLQTSPRADAGLESLGGIDQREILRSLTVPVLLLAGRQDVIVPFDGVAASVELLRDGRLVEFADCGHATFLEDGERYRSELLGFLGGLPS
jgi:non-heme chloroperoxidase